MSLQVIRFWFLVPSSLLAAPVAKNSGGSGGGGGAPKLAVPAAPTQPTCNQVGTALQVDLTWTNAGTYESVEIRRDGALLASVSGTTTTYTDIVPVVGVYSFSLLAVAGGTCSAATSCQAVVSSVTGPPVLPLSNFTCAPMGATLDVSLSWVNASGYDSIQILRDGVLVANAAGYCNQPHGRHGQSRGLTPMRVSRYWGG